jgi:hypothetical protein
MAPGPDIENCHDQVSSIVAATWGVAARATGGRVLVRKEKIPSAALREPFVQRVKRFRRAGLINFSPRHFLSLLERDI